MSPLRAFGRCTILNDPIVTTMRFLLDTSLWHPGAEPTGSVSACGARRTGFRTPIVGFMGDVCPAHALARRAMR
jgi:hypothetical protein